MPVYVYGTVTMVASSQRILILLVAKLILWPDIRLLLFLTEYLTNVGYSNIRIFVHSPNVELCTSGRVHGLKGYHRQEGLDDLSTDMDTHQMWCRWGCWTLNWRLRFEWVQARRTPRWM